MRRWILLLLLSTLASVAAPLAAAPRGQAAPTLLEARGKDLYYGSQKVVLTGTNFDNINALYAKSYNGADVIANGTPANFMVTAADYATIASHGANHVRWGFSYAHWRDHRAALYAAMDQQVAWARANGIFLVWNLFTLPNGGNGSYDCYEGYSGPCPFWGNASYKNAVRDMWVAIASRYATEPAVAGYDLVNEPTPGGPNWCRTWFDLARDSYIPAIRAVSNQLIFVNTCSDPANDLQYNNPPKGPNIVWEVHDYSPMALSHGFGGGTYPSTVSESWWGGSCLANRAAFAGNGTGSACWALDIREMYGISYAASQNMPIYIGEWGSTGKLTGRGQYHRDKAELYTEWGVSHAHYTWAHQTVVSGGYYQWGIVQRGSQTIEDWEKLNGVKAGWVGFRPNFGAPAPATATPAPPTPQPPAEVTSTPTSLPAATLTPVPPTAAPATATSAPATATAIPATATPSATSAATATPAPTAAPAALGIMGGRVTANQVIFMVADAPPAGEAWLVDIRPIPVTIPSTCARVIGAPIVCWAGIGGQLVFDRAPGDIVRARISLDDEYLEIGRNR